MRPVDRMTRTAQAIGGSADLSRRLPEPPQHDELGRLARTFNEMLGQIPGISKMKARIDKKQAEEAAEEEVERRG